MILKDIRLEGENGYLILEFKDFSNREVGDTRKRFHDFIVKALNDLGDYGQLDMEVNLLK